MALVYVVEILLLAVPEAFSQCRRLTPGTAFLEAYSALQQ